MTPFPAITIVQPWAWLIVHGRAAGVGGGKTVENRTWNTRYRGPILIHAGSRASIDVRYDAEMFVLRTFGVDEMRRMPRKLVGAYDYGAIIGKADLVDVLLPAREPRNPWHMRDQFGFVLENAEPLPLRHCKGKLGLWGRWTIVDGVAVPLEGADK